MVLSSLVISGADAPLIDVKAPGTGTASQPKGGGFEAVAIGWGLNVLKN